MNNSNRNLSILMPVYNAEKFLAESIESILEQIYSDFEFIILDDGSTDNSLRIIKKYAKNDKRIKVLVNKKNKKKSKCRNILLRNTTAEFVFWMDADDISVKHILHKQINFLKQNPDIDVVGSQLCHFYGENQLIGSFKTYRQTRNHAIKSWFLFDCPLGTGGCMLRMAKIRKSNIFFDRSLESAEDFDYWIKCMDFLSFSCLDEVLYYYRINKLQDSILNEEKQRNTHLLIVKNHLLKFNIKTDTKSIQLILGWGKNISSSKEIKKALMLVNQICSIKYFYGYTDMNKDAICFITHHSENLLRNAVQEIFVHRHNVRKLNIGLLFNELKLMLLYIKRFGIVGFLTFVRQFGAFSHLKFIKKFLFFRNL